jgi:miniconductance mechanosensitive channel
MDLLQDWIEHSLINAGFAASGVPYMRLFIMLMVLAILSAILFYITRRIIIRSLYKVFRKTSFTWDDLFEEHKAFDNLAHVVPALVVKVFAELIFRDFENALPVVVKITDAYLIIAGLVIVLAMLKVFEYVVGKSPVFADKPVASYFQLARIILYVTCGVLVFSVLLGKSPLYFLSAFGAISAIILLIFKDTILGLVASVQISSNDMVRVGDWVEMPKFNADGDVVAINLNTVKVQNFDKTITTIPTYYFITDSFKNWRGMQESGGRRIKRSIYINVRTIKFVDPDTREHYKKYQLITDYVTQRQQQIEAFNIERNVDTSELINGRRMTNVGVFRHYIEHYLRSLKTIRDDLTLLVRHLPVQDRGLPIEIYCFTNTTNWGEYESIQADIFDHLLAAAAYFELEIYQQPSGSDFQGFANNSK